MADLAPRVSIGLPVYNGAALLPAALDSLLGQTYRDFELVISDNASADQTETICRSYAGRDSRVRYHRQPENIGAIRNFNAVFELAHGQYFKWAAHDDLCAPTFLERCVEVLDRHSDVAWCHTRSTHIDIDGNAIDEPQLRDVSYSCVPSDGPGGQTVPTRESPLPHQRLCAVMLGKAGCLDAYGLIRADVIRKTPLYMPYYGAEKVFIAELGLWGRYREVPETLFFPRVHPQAAGALKTDEEQKQYANPNATRLQFTRIRLLAGYLGAVARADLPLAQRALCLGVVGRYLLQVNKWKAIVARAFSGAGIGGDNASVLRRQQRRSNESEPTTGAAKRPSPECSTTGTAC
jgi:glycosyltransferase involved in cell wall biosynthesis